jgi:hypothetical protein
MLSVVYAESTNNFATLSINYTQNNNTLYRVTLCLVLGLLSVALYCCMLYGITLSAMALFVTN